MSFVRFYNPVEDVFEGRVGRKLRDTGTVPRLFEHYFDQLRPGEVMYAALRGGLNPPHLVPCVHDKETYEVFYKSYYSGAYLDFDVYALPVDAVEE
jgi:hypothetical protein